MSCCVVENFAQSKNARHLAHLDRIIVGVFLFFLAPTWCCCCGLNLNLIFPPSWKEISLFMPTFSSSTYSNDATLWFCRLHGVCKDNPLATVIAKLHLPLYRTCEEKSVLYDHDLERQGNFLLLLHVLLIVGDILLAILHLQVVSDQTWILGVMPCRNFLYCLKLHVVERQGLCVERDTSSDLYWEL